MGAPAGWYDDPQDQQLIRYFDGQSWTTHTAPRPGAGTTAPAASTSAPTASAPSASTGSPAQQPWAQQGQTGAAQQQWGQQGQGGSTQQPWAQQSGASRPSQPQSPTAGFQFGGAQQVPTADTTPSTGTPKSVKIGILAAFLACVLLFVVGYLLSDRSGSGLTASDLGLEDGFGCTEMAQEYVGLSASDADAQRLVAASGGIEKSNRIGTVEEPSGTEQNLVLTCTYPTAEWGDGAQTRLLLELRVDADRDLYIFAEAR